MNYGLQDNRIEYIDNMIMNQRKHTDISNLFYELEKKGYGYVFIGGAIRDAIESRSPRDVDVIVDCDSEIEFENILQEKAIPYVKNRFDGYKIEFESIYYDLWLLKNHFSFKNEFYEADVRNLGETTFMNYDSIVYDANNKKLYADYYDECISRKCISLIGTEAEIVSNPTPEINIVKIFRVERERKFLLADNVVHYIKKYIRRYGDLAYDTIEKEYERHYKQKMDEMEINYLKQKLELYKI